MSLIKAVIADILEIEEKIIAGIKLLINKTGAEPPSLETIFTEIMDFLLQGE